MLYSITCKITENWYGMPPNVAGPIVENLVIPGMKLLADMEKKGKLKGGSFAGQPEGTFIAEFPSNEEASRFVTGLPFWSLYHWEIKPLESFNDTIMDAQKNLETLKALAH
jgi:hypothetical protein